MHTLSIGPIDSIHLLGDTILGKRLEDNTLTSGLILPQNHDPIKTGIRVLVLAVGSKFVHKDIVGIGHTVIVSKHFGTIIDKTQDDVRIYDGEDIIGLVESN